MRRLEIRPIPNTLDITELPSEKFRQYYESLVGVEAYKQRVLTHARICLDPSRFSAWRRQYNRHDRLPAYKKRILFMGAPGTGKTLLAKGSADSYARRNGRVFFAELGSVRGKYVGESSGNVEKACDYVEYLSETAPVVFFIDEFDSVGVSRNTEQMHEDVRAMVNTLIRRMNRMDEYSIFLIAATNLERHVDYATKRRFDFILYFQRPSYGQRHELFRRLVDGWNIPEHDVQVACKRTERYTQDDITRAANLAEELAFAENTPLSLQHLLRAIEQIKPTEEYS